MKRYRGAGNDPSLTMILFSSLPLLGTVAHPSRNTNDDYKQDAPLT